MNAIQTLDSLSADARRAVKMVVAEESGRIYPEALKFLPVIISARVTEPTRNRDGYYPTYHNRGWKRGLTIDCPSAVVRELEEKGVITSRGRLRRVGVANAAAA